MLQGSIERENTEEINDELISIQEDNDNYNIVFNSYDYDSSEEEQEDEGGDSSDFYIQGDHYEEKEEGNEEEEREENEGRTMFVFEKLSACDFCAACADQPNSLEPDAAYRQYGFGEFGAMWRASQLQTDGQKLF